METETVDCAGSDLTNIEYSMRGHRTHRQSVGKGPIMGSMSSAYAVCYVEV